MEERKKRRWFKIKIGWTTTPLWVSQGKRAVRDAVRKLVNQKILDSFVKRAKGAFKLSLKAKIVIRRKKLYPLLNLQTPGMLRIKFGRKTIYQCDTLELPWKDNARNVSCVPPGRYLVKRRYSVKFKSHFHLTNVPNRTWILIHSANFVSDLKGCIAVGDDFVDINYDGLKDVVNSKDTLRKILDIMPKEFELIIK